MVKVVCKCGSTSFFTEKKGTATGLYCSECGKWYKWLTKDEIRLSEHSKNKPVGIKKSIPISSDTKLYAYLNEVGICEIERILEEVLGNVRNFEHQNR